MTKKENGIVTAFFDVCMAENKCWYIDTYHSALMCMDLRNYQTKLMAFIPLDNGVFTDLYRYGSISYANGRLFFPPRTAEKIIVYTIDVNKFEEIAINLDGWEKNDKYNLFVRSLRVKDDIYFIPGRYHSIIKINSITLRLDYITKWYEELSPYLKDLSKGIFNEGIVCNDKLYCACWQNPFVLEIDTNTKEAELVKVGVADVGLSGICHVGDYFWIGMKDIPVVLRWNRDSGECIEYSQLPKDANFDSGFLQLLAGKDCVYAIPLWGNVIVRIDTTTGEMSRARKISLEQLPQLSNIPWIKSTCICATRILGEMAILYSPASAKVIIFNLRTLECKDFDAIVRDDRQIDAFLKRERDLIWKNNDDKNWKEDSLLDISDFIKLIKENSCFVKKNNLLNNGRLIYDSLFAYQ